MSKIKICGIRREDDIIYVNKYLPEFIGFIFAPSKRRISFGEAADLAKNLDPSIKKVGVFVNESCENIDEAINKCDLDVVQIHGDEDPCYFEKLKNKTLSLSKDKRVEVWKALRVKDEMSLLEMGNYKVDGFVLDTFIEGSYGGAGKTFDWTLAVNAKKYGKIILAGGLTSENLIDAINIVNPMVFDVSSGVETDGYKDEKKICDFIRIARSY
ncbi:phosphoribosylanthranilate isomerase [Pseudobacteroides cellulosolvens]|uniref:N-(5'-phosphoribosyl)anthranilate isomerase n=1 Tax=Pseudobacteroides cellulosolvens ATCC 35603 = DSM 2933 TaxID=398512 RepID=A0A0L6JHU1_9FIRM|nr:phosphoribosylanthranilate isomerase [Pseudobacteroides cellulosolvens]KNY25283.1 N-(5'-phosphoribosyl)anthranilate isomerase [Pseudobacteroides cellulosolvens ATCC 35603 = DSM 2933]